MVRNVDYDSRRKAVLTTTINRYIRDALPVASDEIAREFDLSSATIRNIFAELEEGGYLTHPHTSGGRIPTSKGYRYYVDFLVRQRELLDEEKERIVKEYRNKIDRLEDALERTSDIVSAITHYATLVSFIEWQDRLFYRGISHVINQPEFRDLDKIRMLIALIEDKRNLFEVLNRDFNEKVKVYIGAEMGCREMENCALVISSFKRKDKPSGKVAVLGPMRMEYGHIIPTLEYVSDVLTEVMNDL